MQSGPGQAAAASPEPEEAHRRLQPEAEARSRPGVCPALSLRWSLQTEPGAAAPGPAEAGTLGAAPAQGRAFRGSAGPALTGCVLCHTEVMTAQTPAL